MKLTVFGDLHYSENYLEILDFDVKREAYFDQFIQRVFQEEADYYVSVGDLANLGTMMEIDGIYRIIRRHQQDKKFIHTIGNHDLYTQTRIALVEQIQQANYFSIVENDICLIVLDTNREKSLQDWSGYVDPEQLAWFENELLLHSDKIIIVFAHHPLYDTTLFSTADKKSIVPECPIDKIMAKHQGNAVYICGHTHADSIVRRGNWTYIQLADVMNQPVIRNMNISLEGIEVSSILMDEFFKQKGLWLGSRMRHFAITERGYQGIDNRELQINFN